MFSGIVETIGCILKIDQENGCKTFTISKNAVLDDFKIGDSIAVNGVCLTVTHFNEQYFQVTAVPETLRLTNLDQLEINQIVNLERSVQASTRLGGHFVQGHVEAVGHILSIEQDSSQALLVKISLPAALSNYVVRKGYIALDGMSITVIEASKEWFSVTFIPHTQAVTNIQQYQIGTAINIETDILGKYIEKILGNYNHANSH